MSSAHRVPGYGTIDRTRTITFTFDGEQYSGHPGDTLASALLAHGVRELGTSVNLGRPRGIGAAWIEDPSGLVGVAAPYHEPMVTAAAIELCDGLVANSVAGWGRLPTAPDQARYDTVHRHTDVLVIGAGPAGLTAAVTAAHAGARVVIIDDRPEPGGLGLEDDIAGIPAAEWIHRTSAELAELPDVLHLQRTTAFGHYDDGLVLAVQRRTDHLGAPVNDVSRQRIWRLRAQRVIVATGAHERPIAFADNDRPGVLTASAAHSLLRRNGVVMGRRGVVFTSNDSAYAAAFALVDAGVSLTIVDTRATIAAAILDTCAARDIEVRAGRHVRGLRVDSDITGALVRDETLDCDHVLVSGGWNPTVSLYSQAGGPMTYDAALGSFLPRREFGSLSVIGAAAGDFGTETTLHNSLVGVDSALRALGLPARGPDTLAERPAATGDVVWAVPDTDESVTFVDIARDVTVADIRRAVGAGMRSIEHVKRYTTAGTGHDQGKTSGTLASGVTAQLLGTSLGDIGTSSFRPPYAPVGFGALAGRNTGDLFDPVRTTAIHRWHEEQGAVFEDVGQWRRPRYYPRGDEDMDTAVARECAAVRSSVGILDGSTLGTIEVQGPDAGVFLDRMYTNMMSSLQVGRVRYGVMCGTDGMVIDDGTVMRIAEDHYIAYTTTGNAAHVLDWMEEWLQTEWRELRVHLTSSTDHWATFPVPGPRSRDVIGAVFTDVDTSAEAFGFMHVRQTQFRIVDGRSVPVRLARVSFSGELAFEVNVDSRYAMDVWIALIEAGAEYDITPYGTETMHVLRAEKGYPIIGQETDGTVTPHDLGMAWAVSKKKPDFLGKRSFARPANLDPDRKQLVGLLTVDRRTVLAEGAQIVPGADMGVPPVRMLGHVTSSYPTGALQRPFALALLQSGRSRIGEIVHLPGPDGTVAAEVTSSVLYDPEGDRRDG